MQTGRMSQPSAAPEGRRARVVTAEHRLDALVGAHPRALLEMFSHGRPAVPVELGDAPRGRVLSLDVGQSSFLFFRPLAMALGSDGQPWKGKVFDQGGNGGTNVVFGKQVARFRAEVGPSLLDGKPALVLRYDEPAFKNPWPLKAVIDELRAIGDGVAIGPALYQNGGGATPILWFGLEV